MRHWVYQYLRSRGQGQVGGAGSFIVQGSMRGHRYEALGLLVFQEAGHRYESLGLSVSLEAQPDTGTGF